MTDWLPDLMPLDGDWDFYCESIYRRFEEDLRQATFFNLRVGRRRMPIVKGKPDGFWHAISESIARDSEDRHPDPRRCERVPWIGPMISACGTDRVLCWEQVGRQASKGGNSIAVALPTFEFVVILRLRKGGGDPYAMLVTAFCPTSRNQTRMQREYAATGPYRR